MGVILACNEIKRSNLDRCARFSEKMQWRLTRNEMVQQKENEAGLVGIRSLTLFIVSDTIRRIATQSCRYRCEGQNMVLVMILWLLWKAHPGVAICSSFWLSVIWVIRSKNHRPPVRTSRSAGCALERSSDWG
jgi:hypothetical protein